jgi:hypothetical protein
MSDFLHVLVSCSVMSAPSHPQISGGVDLLHQSHFNAILSQHQHSSPSSSASKREGKRNSGPFQPTAAAAAALLNSEAVQALLAGKPLPSTKKKEGAAASSSRTTSQLEYAPRDSEFSGRKDTINKMQTLVKPVSTATMRAQAAKQSVHSGGAARPIDFRAQTLPSDDPFAPPASDESHLPPFVSTFHTPSNLSLRLNAAQHLSFGPPPYRGGFNELHTREFTSEEELVERYGKPRGGFVVAIKKAAKSAQLGDGQPMPLLLTQEVDAALDKNAVPGSILKFFGPEYTAPHNHIAVGVESKRSRRSSTPEPAPAQRKPVPKRSASPSPVHRPKFVTAVRVRPSACHRLAKCISHSKFCCGDCRCRAMKT